MDIDAKIEEILGTRAKLIDRQIEKYVPRRFTEDSMVFKISPPRYGLDLEAANKAISKPFWEFLGRGGKRWRSVLFLLVCEALGCDPKEYLDFAVIPEIIHNGTLMADDVEDSSKLRRGRPCTYRLFGLDIAVNLSDIMFFVPMLALIEKRDKIPSEKARRIYEIYIQQMVNLSFGQATDIAWHRGLTPAYEVSEGQYLQMCAYKTGTLARMAAEMAAVMADADDDVVEKMGKFAESIGVAFQIQDDILDLVGEEFGKRKGGLGMDIAEGKLSLMVVHTLQKAELSDKEELMRILNLHTTDEALRRKAIAIIGKYGSIEYAKNLAAKMIQESWREVDNILTPSEAKETLGTLAVYLVKREI